MAKGDSAASHHYYRERNINVLSNIKDGPGPLVLIPNGDTIAATKNGMLLLSIKLSKAASTAMILPGLTSASSIPIRQLCNEECDVFLN